MADAHPIMIEQLLGWPSTILDISIGMDTKSSRGSRCLGE
jgi:hypothetical protein